MDARAREHPWDTIPPSSALPPRIDRRRTLRNPAIVLDSVGRPNGSWPAAAGRPVLSCLACSSERGKGVVAWRAARLPRRALRATVYERPGRFGLPPRISRTRVAKRRRFRRGSSPRMVLLRRLLERARAPFTNPRNAPTHPLSPPHSFGSRISVTTTTQSAHERVEAVFRLFRRFDYGLW